MPSGNQHDKLDLTNEEEIDEDKCSPYSSFNVEIILSDSSIGKQIIDTYDSKGRLNSTAVLSLVHILVNFLISQSEIFSIENEVFNEVADAIVRRFPNEKKEKYYEQCGKQAKGKLIDCYRIVRENFKNSNQQVRNGKSKTSMKTNGATKVQLGPDELPLPEWVDVAKVAEEPLLNIKWKTHRDCLFQRLPQLLADEKFVDMTVVCEGQIIRCHKMVLCSYSNYFEMIVNSAPSKHPVIFLADLEFWEIQAIINFMYTGEVNIEEDRLPQLFKVATKLNVEGLANVNLNESEGDYESGMIMKEEENLVSCEKHCMDTPLTGPLRKKRKKEDSPTVSHLPLVLNRMHQKNSNITQDSRMLSDDPEYQSPQLAKNFKVTPLNNDTEDNTNVSPLHVMERVPPTEKTLNPRKRCRLCFLKGVRKDSLYWCPSCLTGLCKEPCFQDYHNPFAKVLDVDGRPVQCLSSTFN